MSFPALGLRAELFARHRRARLYPTDPYPGEGDSRCAGGTRCSGGAQTGTGKTAGFTLPMLQKLAENDGPKRRAQIRALVLVPTRELAAQLQASVCAYGKHLPAIRISCFRRSQLWASGIEPQVRSRRVDGNARAIA